MIYKWTEREIKLLKMIYKLSWNKLGKLFPNRTKSSISLKINRLKLKRGYNRKDKNNPNYKDGRRNANYHCIESDCNNKITYWNWLYGKGRCRSCSTKRDWIISEKLKNRNIFGKNHPMYIDGRTSLYFLIRNLAKYKNWRQEVFKRDNYTCQECGDNKGGNLEAHHKKQFAKLLQEFLQEYNQFSPMEDKETLVRLAIKWWSFWDIDNGKTLCKDCHKKIRIIKKIIKEMNTTWH